ncbi:MAG: hypothetical protein IKV82_08975 [Akkermansia sp.]|nr:hypothetical protein [Akkermansia sp.]
MDAYLILCHANPVQVNALARYLADGGHDVFIHIDAASSIRDAVQGGERIHVLERTVAVRWGGWEMVQAMLLLMRAAVATGRDYRYVHLLSGQCLPAMPRREMEKVLAAAAAEGKQLMECIPLPADERWHGRGGIYRMQVWYPRCMVCKYDPAHKFFWRYTNAWLRLGLKRPGYHLFGPYYGGSQWWSLTGDCVRAVCAEDRRHPFMRHFFRNSFCSDEHYVQTCVARAGYAGATTGNPSRYICWPAVHADSPRLLQRDDWARLRGSGCLFARKFELSPRECVDYFSWLES